MMAAELYQKTLAGYEASLGKGESVTLSRYCKIHHVNNRGLRYLMKKHSIDTLMHKSRKVAKLDKTLSWPPLGRVSDLVVS